MSPEWQPAAPDTIGLGWLPGLSGEKLVSSPFQSLAWQFTADATETVTEILAPIDSIVADGAWIVEVYESGGEVASTVQTATFRPIGGGSTGGASDWQKQDTSTSNIWQSVDGSVYDAATYITYVVAATGSPAEFAFTYGTSAWPSGRRVTAVRVSMVCNCGDGSATFTGLADLSGTDYAFGGSGSVGNELATLTYELGEINPDTLLPWTAADIVAFASTDAVGVVGNGGINVDTLFKAYQVWLEVDWVPENRVAVGVELVYVGAESGWAAWDTLVDPNDTAVTDWDKVASGSYVVVLRNLGQTADLYNGSIRFPWLSDGEELPTGWEQAYLPIDATGLITVPFSEFTTTRSTGLLLTVATTGDSADGQPWTKVDGYLDAVTEQQITTLAGGTYERLRFGWFDTTDLTGVTPPAGDLTVKVLRQSDDVQFGSTETFTVAQLQAGTLVGTGQVDPEGLNVTAPLYLIEREFATAPVLATTQYYVEFTGGHAIAVDQGPALNSLSLEYSTYSNVNVDDSYDICEGPDGNLWFTSDNDRVGKITPSGTITTYTSASFDTPTGICVGPDGNLWVASFNNDTVCKVTTAGVVTGYTDAALDGPWGICEGPDGNLWVTSVNNDKICKVTTGGVVTGYTDAALDGPRGICEGPDGNLWVTSFINDNICKVTTGGAVTAYTNALIDGPWDICEGPDGNLWFVCATNSRVGFITTAGVVTTYGTSLVDTPQVIVADSVGLWISSSINSLLVFMSTTGEATSYDDAAIRSPYGITTGPTDSIWFTNFADSTIGSLYFNLDIGAEATYDGTTDVPTVAVAAPSSDIPVTLSTVPDAPTGFDATAVVTDLETATDTACGVDEFDYISLTWTATALAGSFGEYEIQRDNGDALGFQTIAVITDESVEEARDYESIRGTVSYRMRVCRSTDSICSDWTSTQTAVRDAVGDALWLFTSNAYPDLTCAYNVTDQQSYGWPDGPRQRVINHFGTDDKTRYVETERRLTEFPLDLTVYSQGLTSDITQNLGVAPFFPLLELCSQTSAPGVDKTITPYVAVIDPNGNSWYAAVTVDLGNVLVSQSNAHICPANIVQLTETPCPFDLDGGS